MKKHEVRSEILAYATAPVGEQPFAGEDHPVIHISRPSKKEDLYVQVSEALYSQICNASFETRMAIVKELTNACRH